MPSRALRPAAVLALVAASALAAPGPAAGGHLPQHDNVCLGVADERWTSNSSGNGTRHVRERCAASVEEDGGVCVGTDDESWRTRTRTVSSRSALACVPGVGPLVGAPLLA